MGARGPKPKPSALDKLDGGASHRRRSEREPKPPASTGDCPALLHGNFAAQAIWRSLAPGRIRLGLLCEGDELAFAALCAEAAVYWRMTRSLVRGVTQESGANGRVKRPEVDVRKGALESMLKLCASFGMTPADRRGLEVPLGAEAPHAGSAEGTTARATKATGGALDLDAYLRRRDARRAGQPG